MLVRINVASRPGGWPASAPRAPRKRSFSVGRRRVTRIPSGNRRTMMPCRSSVRRDRPRCGSRRNCPPPVEHRSRPRRELRGRAPARRARSRGRSGGRGAPQLRCARPERRSAPGPCARPAPQPSQARPPHTRRGAPRTRTPSTSSAARSGWGTRRARGRRSRPRIDVGLVDDDRRIGMATRELEELGRGSNGTRRVVGVAAPDDARTVRAVATGSGSAPASSVAMR